MYAFGQAVVTDHNDESAVTSCQIYGDLHLRMFHERLDQPQSLWWCKKGGDYVVYENEWVQILVTITHLPSWSQKVRDRRENIMLQKPNIIRICICKLFYTI